MADNFTFTQGTGSTGAADDIGGVLYPRVKIAQGADGSATDVSSAAPLNVTLANTGANATAVKVDGSAVTQPVSASSLPLPTGASTLAEQQTQTTSLQLIDDIVKTDDAAFTPATDKVAVAGFIVDETGTDTLDEGDAGAARVDASRRVLMRIVGATDSQRADVDSSGHLQVDLAAASTSVTVSDGGGSITVDNNGTFAVQSTSTGNVAHDAADSGNPVKIGAKASATLSDDTMVANGDRTDAVSDLDGALLTRGQFPLGDLLSEAVSDTGGSSTAFTNFGATASTRNYVTALHVFRTDAGTTPIFVDFRDGTGGSVLYRMVIPPNGGAILPAGATPYFRTSANTALAYDVSAATTTVYISVSGFKSKV